MKLTSIFSRTLIALSIVLTLIASSWHPARAQDGDNLPIYIVQPSDTISTIARRFGVSPQDLIQVNQLSDPNFISVGTRLKIPGFEGVQGVLTTQPVPLGATLSTLSLQYHIPLTTLVKLNRITSPSQLFIGANLILPVAENTSEVGQIGVLKPGQTPLELATTLGVSAWQLLLQNDLQTTTQILPEDPLLVRSASEGTTESAQNPSVFPFPIRAITMYPLPITQGKTVVIKVESDLPISISGNLGEWALHFNAADDHSYVALQGIHAMAQPGIIDLNLTITSAGGHTFSLSQSALLQPGYYPKDPPLYVDPQTLDKANTEPEDQLVRSVTAANNPVKMWQGLFRKPVDEPSCIKSWFGTRRSYNGSDYTYFHTGVDYGVCANLNIYAPASGVVVFAGPLVVRGNATIIDHGWGVYSGFWHQDKILVKVGDHVEAGQLIGEIGGTGRVTGPHLHWEVWVNGVQVEPLDWLEREFP